MTTTLKSKADIVDIEVKPRLRSDDCAKTLSYRRYRRLGNVTRIGDVEKKPALAPAHRKPEARILTELTKKVDDDIRMRSSAKVPQCLPCDFVDEKVASKSAQDRDFYHGWTEKFELRDSEGNVIRGTAAYRATGRAKIETTVIEKTCDKRFGDDPKDFDKASFDPGDLNIQVVAGYSLRKFWAALPSTDREGLELIGGSETTA